MEAKNCKCPLCDLLHANVNICDFMIRKGLKGYGVNLENVNYTEPDKFDNLTHSLIDSIIYLTDHIIKKNKGNFDVGESAAITKDSDDKRMIVNVYRVSRITYKVCVHVEDNDPNHPNEQDNQINI